MIWEENDPEKMQKKLKPFGLTKTSGNCYSFDFLQ
jgi:hypothetical protein